MGGHRSFMNSHHRLRHGTDIARVRQYGKRVTNPYFVLFAAPSGADRTRLSIITPRHLGTAVVRNRMRRRLRAAFRLHLDKLDPPADLVAHARRAASQVTWSSLTDAVTQSLAKTRAHQSSRLS